MGKREQHRHRNYRNPLKSTLYLLATLLAIPVSCFAVIREPSAVLGLIPQTQSAINIDGELSEEEYRGSLCTPVEYFHDDLANRPGQFFYLWDNDALYIGVRTLDQRAFAPQDKFWEGDAVEFYLDTRSDVFGVKWPLERFPGAVHCFFTAMTLNEVRPRFALRPNYSEAIPNKGIAVAARRTFSGLEMEMRMPWLNFPDFKPKVGEVVRLDAELSYSEGGPRSFRTFAFGSPLSVPHPANLAQLQLTNRLETDHWNQCGPVMMPVRIDEPWTQTSLPLKVVAQIAIPPYQTDKVGKIAFQVMDLCGNMIGQFDADTVTYLDVNHQFIRREATWSATLTSAGRFLVYAVVFDSHGNELCRIAPRLKSVNMSRGY